MVGGMQRPTRSSPRSGIDRVSDSWRVGAPRREQAWLPGLAEPVPDHPRFPKLVEAIRTMRERDAWLHDPRPDGRRSTAASGERADQASTWWPLLAVLLLGVGLGSLTTLALMPTLVADLEEDAAAPATSEASRSERREGGSRPVELLGAGRAQATEPAPSDIPVREAEDAPDVPSERSLKAAVEVIRQALPTAPARPSAASRDADLNRKLGRALYELGQRQQDAGNVAAALASYKRSASLDPDHAQTWYDWGWLLQQRGDIGGALEKYRATIEREPRHPFAHYNMGYLMQQAGDVTSAQIVYENALAAGAANSGTLYNLGWLMQKAGDEISAMQHYEAALREAPDHALANYNLGYLHERRGDLGLAIEHYRRAFKSDPSLITAAERLAALQG